MPLSVHAAARYSGNATSTILREIISGRLSAERRADGTYQIAEAELDRAYPPDSRYRLDAFGPIFPAADPKAPGSLAAILEAELAGLVDVLRRADAAFVRAFLPEGA
jgi:hypothetical protein